MNDYLMKVLDPNGRFVGLFMADRWAVCDLLEGKVVNEWSFDEENVRASLFLEYDQVRGLAYLGLSATCLSCYDANSGRRLWRNANRKDNQSDFTINPRNGDLLMSYGCRLGCGNGERVTGCKAPEDGTIFSSVAHPELSLECHVVDSACVENGPADEYSIVMVKEGTSEFHLCEGSFKLVPSVVCFAAEEAFFTSGGAFSNHMEISRMNILTGVCRWRHKRHRRSPAIKHPQIHLATNQIRCRTLDTPDKEAETEAMCGNGLLVFDFLTGLQLSWDKFFYRRTKFYPGSALVLKGDRVLLIDGKVLDAGTLEVVEENIWRRIGLQVPIKD
jgi:hypothetical protein